MGKFHKSKKSHSEGKKNRNGGSSNSKAGTRKLDDNFIYTQKHKRVFTEFCNFLDEKFAEEDLSEILNEEEVARLKIPPVIPPLLEFEPEYVGIDETEEERRARARAQSLADKSYASKDASHQEGLRKLKQKFNRATLLILKYVDQQINLDLHQFLKLDRIKGMEPEAKYHATREYLSENWGPHSSLDVTKIEQDMVEMKGDDPGWRIFMQGFSSKLGSLSETMQRDASGAKIYGVAPPSIYPPRPDAAAPAAELQAYIIACQAADDLRAAEFPHGGPALNHRPSDAKLKTILLDALAASRLSAYKTLYQQYCNRSHIAKTFQDLFNDINDLVKYDEDGVRSSTRRDSDAEADSSDGSRSRNSSSSKSSNSHSSHRAAQIRAAAVYKEQQLALNTSANSSIHYQSSPNSGSGSPKGIPQGPCKNCKSTSHGTKYCTSTKCFEKNCGKTFNTAEERKTHFIEKHGFGTNTQSPKQQLKPALKGNKVKFSSKVNRVVGKINRVQSNKTRDEEQVSEEEDSDISSDSSMSIDNQPKALIWRENTNRPSPTSGRKVSRIRNVSTIHHVTKAKLPVKEDEADAKPSANDPPPLQGAEATPSAPQPADQQSSSAEQSRAQAPDKGKRQAEEEHYGMPRGEPRPRFAGEHKSYPTLSPAEQEAEGIRQAIRIEEWYAAHVRDEEWVHGPSHKGTIRISEDDRDEEPDYLRSDGATNHPTEEQWDQYYHDELERERDPNFGRQRDLADLAYDYEDYDSDEDNERIRITARSEQDDLHNMTITPFHRYKWYREEGGQRKFFAEDNGTEVHYAQWQPDIQLEEGEWMEDYNYIRPSPSSVRDGDYCKWYSHTHPVPTTMEQAVQFWVNRRRQLERCQVNHPRSYESYLRLSHAIDKPEMERNDTWDSGQIYRLHLIRAQAAADIKTAIVTEADVDDFLIYSAIADRYRDDPKPSSKDKPRNVSAPDTRARDHPENQLPGVIGLVATSRQHPGPFGGCETREDNSSSDREMEFFTRSLSEKAPKRSAKDQGLKSSIHMQSRLIIHRKATEAPVAKPIYIKRIDPSRKGTAQTRNILNISAIVDTGAQVTTMPESAVSRMPQAHNHRHAPPGTAVKYGNGEYEAIETLVDIGHFEVQVTPDNCEATLISVDQIVANGHTVTFTSTSTIISDLHGRYTLAYPREANIDSREWRVPMTALEDITRMRQQHPYTPMDA